MRRLTKMELATGHTCVFETFRGRERVLCGKPAVAASGTRYVCQEHADYAMSIHPQRIEDPDERW